jgi:acyl-CoA thioesterase II
VREVITEDLLEVLELEKIDTNLYTGINELSARYWPALFGGQVAAQALRAAAYTIPEGRLPHSFHGYFLRPGRGDLPVLFKVDRDRDGGAFSSRQVVAVQEGEVIFSLAASFQSPRPEAVEWCPPREPAFSPEEVEDGDSHPRFETTLEIRGMPPTVPYEEDQRPVPARMWLKSAQPLPDDPIVHTCVMTYASDVGSGFGDGTVAGVRRGGTSLDHAMWFQQPIRMDDWVLLESWPIKTGGGRGLYSGMIQDRQGRVGAVLTQEFVFRRARPNWTPPTRLRPLPEP